MGKIMTLSGTGTSLGDESRSGQKCKCVFNTRTKRWSRLCFVGKSNKNRSGWQFVKGASQHCKK